MWNGENQSIRVTSDQNDNIIFLNDPIETNKSFQASSKYNLGNHRSYRWFRIWNLSVNSLTSLMSNQ